MKSICLLLLGLVAADACALTCRCEGDSCTSPDSILLVTHSSTDSGMHRCWRQGDACACICACSNDGSDTQADLATPLQSLEFTMDIEAADQATKKAHARALRAL